MIAKLRIKFILISTAAVLLVISVLIGLVNSVMYSKTLDSVYQIAGYIADNDGQMPSDHKKITDDFTDEDVYRIRFFSIKLDSDLEVISSDLDKISSVDETEINNFVKDAESHNFKNGHLTEDENTFAYTSKATSYGRIIVFVNCTNEFKTVENFREMSFLYGVFCLLGFVIIVSVLSRRAVEPVIRNAESQKQFITNASHELKTPLAVISANTEVLEMTNGESEWTKSIISQVNRLNTLIAELITISKFGEGDKKELVTVNASKVVSDCANDFKPVFSQQGISFDFSVAENISLKATDEGIRQITGILLDNAAKYCDEGGNVNLSLTPKTVSKGMKLTVSNTYKEGAGKDLSRYFDRFYREDESHNSKKGGYGIGLAMAQGYVKEFGGRMSVSYKGDTISFTVAI
ncbi:MAG: HAMP domain-containing histidine kinase [Ruminococcaceae bacterium]|nr:HAMP domain-containing histidine kinase [Oscillospiraceae bacterium]